MTITEFITARLEAAMVYRQRKNPQCPCGAPTEPHVEYRNRGLIGFLHPVDPSPVYFDGPDFGVPNPSTGFMVHEFYPGNPMYETAQESAFEPLADKPEYAVMRKIVELHGSQVTIEGAPYASDEIRAIAAIWKNHPDYESEWA